MFRNIIKTHDRFYNLMLYVPHRTAKFELPFKWERPAKVPIFKPEKAGDLQPFKEIDMKQFPSLFKKSEELKTADENVQRLFSLEFQNNAVVNKEISNIYMDLVKRHQWDNSSPEAKIAAMTGRIRQLQIAIEKYKDKKPPRKLRVYIKELVEKRAMRLRVLRQADYKLFEWVIEKLDLVHKAKPIVYEKVERKKSIRRLTDIYCDSLRQERLDQYREHLESQQEEFVQKKLETYKWIQNKEKEYGVNLTITDEEISSLVEQLEELKSNKKEVVEN